MTQHALVGVAGPRQFSQQNCSLGLHGECGGNGPFATDISLFIAYGPL